MSRIERLTPEQEAAIPAWRDEWLTAGLATGLADRKRAVAGVAAAYRAGGLEPPALTIWLRSPLEGAVGAAILAQVGDQVWDQVWAQVGDQVWDQVWDQVGDQVWAQVWDQVGDQVRAQVWDQVRDQVGDQVRDQVGDQVWDQVRRCGYGQHDANWVGLYRFFSHHCGLDAPTSLNGLAEIAMSCGWWWPFENAVILTERPGQLHRDAENRLHREDGPALLYPDGWGIWAWHGVRVPQHVIERPAELTVADALAEPNAEIRRVMLTRIGPERMAREGGLSVVDEIAGDAVEVGVGADGLPLPVGLHGAKLYRTQHRDEMPPMQFVALKNSTPEPDGSIKDYMLRVPPDVQTVREAVAWTFGVEAGDYQPRVET